MSNVWVVGLHDGGETVANRISNTKESRDVASGDALTEPLGSAVVSIFAILPQPLPSNYGYASGVASTSTAGQNGLPCPVDVQ